MMADSSDNSREDDDKILSVDYVDPPHVTLVCSSNTQKFSRGTYDRERRACNLDLSNSPSLRPGSAARDSGYNTDVSPAATISPATNTPRQQHFVFDNISHNNIPELEDRISSLAHVSPYLANGSIAISPLAPGCHSPYQLHFEQRSRSTPPLRLSPDIFKIGASPCRTTCLGTQTPSRPLSEASDTNRIQFDFESDNEEDSANREIIYHGSRISAASRSSCDHFDQSESCLGLPTPILCQDSDEGDDEDVFHKSDDVLKNWGIRSDATTPINRSRFSIRQRRYCSADDDESLLGACGGRDLNSDVHFHGSNATADRRRHSFNESSRGRTPTRRSYVAKATNGSRIEDNVYAKGSVSCTHSESSLSSDQYIQPCHFDACDSRDSDCENVFTFDPDDIDGDDDISNSPLPNTRDTRHSTALRDRSSQNSVIRARLRRFSVTAYLRLSSGCLLPWSNSINRVSVATQTPHMVSVMIQQLLDTPVPLPNEARGTAAALLRRRQSEGGLPQGSRQLPDIVPYVRDRAMSVPDAQTLARMQRAREVGRELRRLSDEFHFGIFNLESVNEEVDGRFRQLNPRFLSNPLSNILAFFRQTFHRRPRRRRAFRPGRSTSVDRAGHLASMEISEVSEDLPGD